MSAPYLTEVRRLPGQRLLRLTWSDGHVVEHDYDVLRGWCPCAGCQGHDTLQLRYHPPPSPVTPEEIEPVGNYALSILWSDGHGTGIYRFDYLRQLAGGGRASEIDHEPSRHTDKEESK